MAAVLVLSFFGVILGLLLLWNRNKNEKLPPLAEGALPIIGHCMLAFVSNKYLYKYLVNTIVGASVKKGRDAATIRLGIVDVFVVMNPDDGYVVASSCLKKDTSYDFFKPCFGDGLINADVPVWKKHRKLLNPTLKQSVLNTFLTKFNDQSRQLVAELSEEVKSGYFDPLPYLKRMMIQVACATIIGVDLKDKATIEKTSEAVLLLAECMAKRMQLFWYNYDALYAFSSWKKKEDEAAKIVKALSCKILKKIKDDLVSKGSSVQCEDEFKPRFKSFLDLAIELSKNETLTETEIIDEVTTFISASFDTTYQSVGITLLILGAYPDVQQKVFEELQEVFGDTDRDVEKKDISKLTYMEAVIKETLRLYPVILSVGRTIGMNLNLKNYTLPAGSRCYVSIYHVNRHSSWGPDADVFRPERWLDGSLPTNINKAFATFGLGRRNCIGAQCGVLGEAMFSSERLQADDDDEILMVALVSIKKTI